MRPASMNTASGRDPSVFNTLRSEVLLFLTWQVIVLFVHLALFRRDLAVQTRHPNPTGLFVVLRPRHLNAKGGLGGHI